MDTMVTGLSNVTPQLTVQGFIGVLVEGRSVLHVGCVNHNAAAESETTWLHKHICAHAASVLGVDVLEDEVSKLRAMGYNIVAGDVMQVEFTERFDVVVAGEIIEHLEDPGAFIRKMARHLKPGGQLVLTTPNVFFVLHWCESLFADPARRWNAQHIAWFDNFTLGNLVARCGLEIQEVRYFARSRKVTAVLTALRVSQCPRALASTIVVVARKPAA